MVWKQILPVGACLGLSAWALLACGPTPTPPGSAIDTRELAANGPRIPNGSIWAAGDLTTLRALIDASDTALARQLGGKDSTFECRAPYTYVTDICWPGQVSTAGYAYIAMNISGGFCQTASAPSVFANGRNIEVQVVLSDVFGCHMNGVLALPTAALIAFPTQGLKPGLYSVSYLNQSDKETYHSDSTYLSIPSPVARDQIAMEKDAADALTSVIDVGTQRSGLFSLARVDGAQIESLCSETVAGPAYLVTYERDIYETPPHMTVVLAGPLPHTCSVTRV